MDPLFVMSSLGVSILLLLCNSKNTMKNMPVKPKTVESLFFNLESQSAMPEIVGLAAVGIPFEAERQENWYSLCQFEKVGGLKFKT